MEDYELTLFDRINIIRDTIKKYGEENFYIAFSGGKDSTVLHYLIDLAIPNNHIPRVYVDTGIGYKKINEFVESLSQNDKRIITIRSDIPIKRTLEKYGYPFKSKHHSYMLEKYQRLGMIFGVKNYLGIGENMVKKECPKKLRYQFTEEFKLKVSDLCCLKMKEQPMEKWGKENNRNIAITGIMKEEGGRRISATCLTVKNGKLKFFNPLSKVTSDFETWFINRYDIRLCELYYPPFNFHRTGCMGCPFAIELQEELDVLEEKIPIEKKRAEIIWKPVYDEYRRIGYRLRKETDYETKH